MLMVFGIARVSAILLPYTGTHSSMTCLACNMVVMISTACFPTSLRRRKEWNCPQKKCFASEKEMILDGPIAIMTLYRKSKPRRRNMAVMERRRPPAMENKNRSMHFLHIGRQMDYCFTPANSFLQ